MLTESFINEVVVWFNYLQHKSLEVSKSELISSISWHKSLTQNVIREYKQSYFFLPNKCGDKGCYIRIRPTNIAGCSNLVCWEALRLCLQLITLLSRTSSTWRTHKCRLVYCIDTVKNVQGKINLIWYEGRWKFQQQITT